MSDKRSSSGRLRIGIDARYVSERFPGIGRYLHGLLTGLAGQETQHQYFVLVNERSKQVSQLDLGSIEAVPHMELIPLNTPTISLAEQIRVPSAAARLALDVMHCPYFVVPYQLPVPYVLTLYDVIPFLFPEDYPAGSRVMIRLLTQLASRRAAHCMLISESAQRDVEHHLGLSQGLMTVAHLGVSSAFHPQPEDAIGEMRRRLDLAQRYVLYVGTFKPHKNVVRLLHAWDQLDLGSPWQLVIAGLDSHRYPAPKDQIARMGLASTIRLLGSVRESDLPSLYSGASAFVFPSLYEGFGLPVLEAMACATPVICSRSSSLPEVAGDAAILIDPLDVSDIAAALKGLLDSPSKQTTLSQLGLVQARRFSWSKMAHTTQTVYELVANTRP